MKPTAEEFYYMLQKRPFQPFRVYLTDGRQYDICFPKINVVGVDFLVIGIPVPNDPDPVAQDSIQVPLDKIDRVEFIPAATFAE